MLAPLDEDAILDYWAAGTYKLTHRSCCACVLILLVCAGLPSILSGSSRYYGSTPNAGPIVTPNDLATVARAANTSVRPERAPAMRRPFMR